MRGRGLPKAIVGIPKTIDNDIEFVFTSFGYNTALEKAEEVLRGAHVEARGAPNGIGLVKLMGRNAGFIAAGAALASQDANFVLMPEVPLQLEGEAGFLAALERPDPEQGTRAHRRGRGGRAGPPRPRRGDGETPPATSSTRTSACSCAGEILAYFKERKIPINLKYIDPSYYIRSVPANSGDRILSDQMARMAVHAGMAGKTDVLIGYWHNELIHVPICTAIARKRQLDLTSDLWTAVMRSTGQTA